jgi:hypothetical protein
MAGLCAGAVMPSSCAKDLGRTLLLYMTYTIFMRLGTPRTGRLYPWLTLFSHVSHMDISCGVS